MGVSRGKDVISLYVDAELKADLQKYAQLECRSLTNFIIWLLMNYRNEHPLNESSDRIVMKNEKENNND